MSEAPLAAPVVAALITAGFAFTAGVIGILWTESNKRREEERKHSREANMMRRILVADLDNARTHIQATIDSIKQREFDPLTFYIPQLRDYPLEKVGMLSVDEIRALSTAANMLAHLQSAVGLVATRREPANWYLMSLDAISSLLPEIEDLPGYLKKAVTELKAETGPVP